MLFTMKSSKNRKYAIRCKQKMVIKVVVSQVNLLYIVGIIKT